MIRYLIFVLFIIFSPQIYSEKVMILDSIKKNILDNKRFLIVNKEDVKKRFSLSHYEFDIFSGGVDSSLGDSDYKINFLYRYDAIQRSRMPLSDWQDGYFMIFMKVNNKNNAECKVKDQINFLYNKIFDIDLNEGKLKEIDLKLQENKETNYIFKAQKGSIGVKFINSDNEYDYYKIYIFS